MSRLRSAWNRLGFSYGGSSASSPPFLEEVLVESLEEVREDPRLFLGAATWLHSYGVLVDGHQLSRRLKEVGSKDSSALLAALIVASSSPHLKGLLASCKALSKEEILFTAMNKKKFLRERVAAEAIPEIRKWGFLVDDLTLKPDALRPSSWVLRNNPDLKVRALLGANLRSAVWNWVRSRKEPLSISEVSRGIDRPYPSIHAAVGTLLAAGMLRRETKGRATMVSIPKDIEEWISSYPAALTPKDRKERAA